MNNREAIQFIKDELAKRVAKNPNYSLRAFSSLLNMNIGTVSSILNGKRKLTKKALEQICDRLNLAPDKRESLISLVSKYKEKTLDLENGISRDRARFDNDTFVAMTEWYHWAILQLVRVDDYGSKSQHKTTKWFSTRLGVSETNIKLALDRLVNLGLIRIEENLFVRTNEQFTSKNRAVTSPALRQLQKGLREKAIESLENDPIEMRSMTSMTMAVDPQKLQQARVLIEEFQEKMSVFLEEGKREKVYQLTVSLFPLERGEKV